MLLFKYKIPKTKVDLFRIKYYLPYPALVHFALLILYTTITLLYVNNNYNILVLMLRNNETILYSFLISFFF